MDGINDGPQWYALNVKTGYEHYVSAQLQQRGETDFLPTYNVSVRRAGRDVICHKPLFPGYLFCHFSWSQGPKLYTIVGFLKVVGAGKTPIAVPDEDIDAIQRVVCSGLTIQSLPMVQPASRVIVTDGPLRGLKGTIVAQNNSESLIVSVPLLQRSLAVVLDRNWLSATVEATT
jgi:transcriptional antiterminator RfaH